MPSDNLAGQPNCTLHSNARRARHMDVPSAIKCTNKKSLDPEIMQ
jgi:hypothetical protein